MTSAKALGFELNKADTAALKALAILFIVAHNYFHFLPPVTGENEMTFSPEHIQNVLMFIWANPLDAFHPIVSFFGHYGVHIFIFLSGYGLTKKCLSSNFGTLSELYRVSIRKIVQVIKLSLVGLMFLCVYRVLVTQDPITRDFFLNYLKFLTFTENLRPGKLYYFVSVWWFLALIVQFYILFPWIYRFCLKSSAKRFFLVCGLFILVASILYQPMLEHQLYVYATPLGQFSVFALGVYFATGKTLPKYSWIVFLLCLPLGFAYLSFFHLSFITVTILALLAYERLMKPSWAYSRVLQFVGSISMYIYIVHGDMRWILINWIETVQSSFLNYIVFGGYLLEVLACAWLCARLTKRVPVLR